MKKLLCVLLVLVLFLSGCGTGGRTDPFSDQAQQGNGTQSETDAQAAALYTEEDYLRFFEENLLPLINDAPHQEHDYNGYAGALPLEAVGKAPRQAYLNLYWNTLLDLYRGDSAAYRKYDLDCLTDSSGDNFNGDRISDMAGLTDADLETAHHIEQQEDNYTRFLWAFLEQEKLQMAIDNLLGNNRLDIAALTDAYQSNGTPVSFVSSDGRLFYLTVDGIGGDISDYRALYKVIDSDIGAEKATFTFKIFYVSTLPADTDYYIMQTVKANSPEEYLAKSQKNPRYDDEWARQTAANITEWPVYFLNTISSGDLQQNRFDRLKNAGYEEALLLTDTDEALLEPVEITFYNTEDGIRLWDINCPDESVPAEQDTGSDAGDDPQTADHIAAYRDYLSQAFGDNYTVALLADVTWDGLPELIVVYFDGQDDTDGYVFTFRDGAVKKLEEKHGGMTHAKGGFSWYITEYSPGKYDLIDVTSIIYQGRGYEGYDVYHLLEDGSRDVDDDFLITTDNPEDRDEEGLLSSESRISFRENLALALENAFQIYDLFEVGDAAPLPDELLFSAN